MVVLRTGMGDYHDPRGSLAYAVCLLQDGRQKDAALAERIIDTVLSMQERRPGTPTSATSAGSGRTGRHGPQRR
jgi:hypothetical protein